MSDDRENKPVPVGLRAEGIVQAYEQRVVLDVPEFEVPAGQTCALLGPSGSGKSTLLRILALLEEPRAGRVLIDSTETSRKDRAVRRSMAAVFQNPYLFNGTVAQNVAYGLRLRGVPRDEREALVAETLERVGLAGFEDRSALRLSGGEAQRVALARALVLRPRVLFLDEPLSSLDTVLKRRMSHEFARILGEQGVTTVYVTHDQDEAMTVANRIAIMRDGGIVHVGPAQDVMVMPGDEWVAGFIGMEPPVRGVVVSSSEGLIAVRCDDVKVFATGDVSEGTQVALGIRPEDVSLFSVSDTMPSTSIRNRIEVQVADVVPAGSTQRVILVSGGFRIAARVSLAAVQDLGIVPGMRLVAAFKASAVRVSVNAGRL